MVIVVEVLISIIITMLFAIWFYFKKRDTYQQGYIDGMEHYSRMVDEVLHQVNRFNEEAEEAGMEFTAYVESINPLIKEVEE